MKDFLDKSELEAIKIKWIRGNMGAAMYNVHGTGLDLEAKNHVWCW